MENYSGNVAEQSAAPVAYWTVRISARRLLCELGEMFQIGTRLPSVTLARLPIGTPPSGA